MKIKPLGERVLVEPIKEDEVAKGGIIIPDSAKEKPQEGKIIAIGTGKIDENGIFLLIQSAVSYSFGRNLIKKKKMT